jgi:hypothetical protein
VATRADIATKLADRLTLEQTCDARARAWAFVFDCYRKKEAATSPVSRPDDAKGRIKDDSSAKQKYTR